MIGLAIVGDRELDGAEGQANFFFFFFFFLRGDRLIVLVVVRRRGRL